MEAATLKHRIYNPVGFRGLVDLHLEANKQRPIHGRELEILEIYLHKQGGGNGMHKKCVDAIIRFRKKQSETTQYCSASAHASSMLAGSQSR
ncbi:MAG: hypothetical protein GKR92_05360 [Gammaproteobacteria bacterium]|nr:MAG: hypothetical protein GKR92_05360 [Gammaproteobacteria bacterium]